MALHPDLEQRVVALTGGAHGIGAATVRAFHQQGARVCFCDVDADAGAALAAELGLRAQFTRVDLRREAQVKRWIQGIARRHGRIDVLVNNAASDPRIPLAQCTAAQWDDLFARNLRAMFLTAREAAPHLPDDTGAIVNFSSLTFFEGPREMTAYVATKAGVIGFTRSLARELGPRGIRVNTVCPGWIMTERQLRQFVTAQVKRMLLREQCIPQLNQPEEIAEVVLFLASAASRAMTGQALLVDRGWKHH
jgi:NAD(P)-dependent dehydrogenase (short-subunit alcohol dehydrogenase family)